MKTRPLLLTAILLLIINSNLFATTFKCFPPTAGGIFTIGLKSLTENCTPIEVFIPFGISAEDKATLIANRINASCAGVFTASASGDKVTVVNSVHPGQRVLFKFGPDATGEKTKIEDDLAVPWWQFWAWGSEPLFTCANTSSGTSYGGASGYISLGTSTYVATVPTSPGASPVSLMTALANQLNANGVSATLVPLPGIAYGINLNNVSIANSVEFTDEDTGTLCTFEMTESNSVPTLPEWGLIILGSVMLFIGVVYLNRFF